MYRLLNSAMMPAAGVYTLRQLTPEEFGDQVASAHAAGKLDSYPRGTCAVGT